MFLGADECLRVFLSFFSVVVHATRITYTKENFWNKIWIKMKCKGCGYYYGGNICFQIKLSAFSKKLIKMLNKIVRKKVYRISIINFRTKE